MASSPRSCILLSEAFDETVEALQRAWPEALFLRIEADEFLVEHAEEAIRRAALTGERERVIVLAARRFTPIAQNKLLKILEEPPAGVHFVLVTPSKSGLLPTIRSRLPLENRLEARPGEESGIAWERFDLEALYQFLHQNRRIDAAGASAWVQRSAVEVAKSGLFRMDRELLEAFGESVRLLDMGSPPPFVLTRLGLKLLEKRR